MYMYPIIIKREAQVVFFEKEFDLGTRPKLTLAMLKKFGVTDDNTFSVYEESGDGDYTLYVNGKRLETQKELDKRVKREETYMKNYTEFHANKKI